VNWTVAELERRAAQALADSDVHVANGRVTARPDRRMIRWYSTIGLLDRPSAQGREARYGPRHLLQLVAIKRLQAQGRALSEIQVELAGATDAHLVEVARVPPALLDQPVRLDGSAPLERSVLVDDWSSRSNAGPVGGDPVHRRAAPAVDVELAPSREGHGRFWTTPPVAAHDEAGPSISDGADLITGVRLGGVVLLLPRTPDADDIAAIHIAAQPLLDLLVHRGLLPGGSTA